MRKLLVVLVSVSACIGGDDASQPLESLPAFEDTPEVAPYRGPSADPAQCALLPDDGSACAHACDQDALKAFIPEGMCATFECPLTDGSTFRAGGCNVPETE